MNVAYDDEGNVYVVTCEHCEHVRSEHTDAGTCLFSATVWKEHRAPVMRGGPVMPARMPQQLVNCESENRHGASGLSPSKAVSGSLEDG